MPDRVAKITLHDLDNPPPKRFEYLSGCLNYCWKHKVTGYVHIWEEGRDPEVITLQRGKRRRFGGTGLLVPCNRGHEGKVEQPKPLSY